eukprot:Awhi_evm1s3581
MVNVLDYADSYGDYGDDFSVEKPHKITKYDVGKSGSPSIYRNGQSRGKSNSVPSNADKMEREKTEQCSNDRNTFLYPVTALEMEDELDFDLNFARLSTKALGGTEQAKKRMEDLAISVTHKLESDGSTESTTYTIPIVGYVQHKKNDKESAQHNDDIPTPLKIYQWKASSASRCHSELPKFLCNVNNVIHKPELLKHRFDILPAHLSTDCRTENKTNFHKAFVNNNGRQNVWMPLAASKNNNSDASSSNASNQGKRNKDKGGKFDVMKTERFLDISLGNENCYIHQIGTKARYPKLTHWRQEENGKSVGPIYQVLEASYKPECIVRYRLFARSTTDRDWSYIGDYRGNDDSIHEVISNIVPTSEGQEPIVANRLRIVSLQNGDKCALRVQIYGYTMQNHPKNTPNGTRKQARKNKNKYNDDDDDDHQNAQDEGTAIRYTIYEATNASHKDQNYCLKTSCSKSTCPCCTGYEKNAKSKKRADFKKQAKNF